MKSYIKNMFNSCVKSVLPRNIIKQSVKCEKQVLYVNDVKFSIPEKVYMIGFGKAVLEMALEVEKMLDGRLYKAILSVPFGTRCNIENSIIDILEGASNNIPDQYAVDNTKRIVDMIRHLNSDDVLIVLISGGGSALLCSPTVSLADKIYTINLLSSNGASIKQLNAVRKALSDIKGGKLIGLVNKATVIALILSDIIGDPLNAIASGPTVRNDDPTKLPLEIVNKLNLLDKLPKTVLSVLEKNHFIGDIDFAKVHNFIIGNNNIALKTGVNCSLPDYIPVLLSNSVQGNVSQVSNFYSNLIKFICKTYILRDTDEKLKQDLISIINVLCLKINVDNLTSKVAQASLKKSGLCLLSGGEPTVIVQGNGVGGRNQELALRVAIDMDKNSTEEFKIMFFSGGTDGIDGPTDACGAFGYPELVNSAKSECLNPLQFVENNDSYGFYSKYNRGEDLYQIGHTGTNVMDLHILIIEPRNKNNLEEN